MHLLILSTLVLVAAPIAWTATSHIRRSPKAHPLALELSRLINPFDPAVHERIRLSGHPTCEVAEAPLKEKLKRIENELAEAREERVGLASARDEARAQYAGTESLSADSDEFKAAEHAVRELGECDDKIDALQKVQVATLRMLGKDTPAGGRQGHDRAAGNADDPRGWNSAHIFESEDIRAQLAFAAHTKTKFGGIELGEVVSRDALAADITGTTSMRRGNYGGIVPQLRRQLRVLDLLPTGTMDENTFPYTQESGSFTTAAETAEGAQKPEGGLTLTDAEAVAATIAHWLKIRKQALADSSALQSIVDSRLRYGVERRLEAEVLAGDGLGANITGILNTSGLGNVAFDNTQLPADQVLHGITTVLLADAQATGIVMNPLDWENAVKAKAAGDGHYFSNGPFSMTPEQMWGVPLIPSASIAQGTALVGDFEIGAMLLIREGVNVLLSDSDQDDFIRNRVTMLGEMRAALPVFRPAAFSTVHFS
jgi:HK97 family phage major capsid protein